MKTLLLRKPVLMLLALAVTFGAAAADAQPAPLVEVSDAWVRVTVPGQSGTGAFMKFTARENARLVSITTPVAGVAELHEMRMDGEVMRMRAVTGLDLPAGRTIELKPGGYHLMLMDLKSPVRRDTSVPMTLVFTDSRGVQSRLELSVPVSVSAPARRPATR